MIDFLIKKFVPNYQAVKEAPVRRSYGQLAGLIGIVCNLLLAVGKGLAGLVSGSVSITADAVNNLSDASSNIVSLLGFKLAGKPADPEHPYGHARYEYLAGLIVAFFIMLIGYELGRKSIVKLLEPEEVVFTWLNMLILFVSILVKLWMMFFNRKIGRLIQSETLIATAVDSRNDVLTTTAVLIAALVSHFVGLELDAWMGLLVAIFVLYSGIDLIKDTLSPLLGEAPSPDLVQHIHTKVKTYPGVMGLHDLMVHDYGPGHRFASVHVEMAAEEDVLQSHEVIDDIEQDFLQEDGLHLVVHLDPIVTHDPEVNAVRAWLEEAVKEVDKHLSVHDIRLVKGNHHSNLIFDVVRPPDLALSAGELKSKLTDLVQTQHPNYRCLITVDENYTGLEAEEEA
ncbi:MAG: cation diffusion facilitator family transporter [Eubacteriales bacterium]|nr:cation diffusion facilitator family transporter [Eubacteriales bacterium]